MSHKTMFPGAPLLWIFVSLSAIHADRPASAEVTEVEALFGATKYLGMAPCEIECQIIYENQSLDTCQLRNQIIYEERVITTYEPVWETEMRTCYYTVARPETQVIERAQRCVVIKPVWETQICDRSYDVVRNVVETCEREERYTVSRLVYETECREQKVQVSRYVTRTVDREVPQVTHTPVTRMRTEYVDKGSYVTEQVQKPRRIQFSVLRWAPGGWGTDPANGKKRYELPGFVWVKKPKMRTVSQTVWQPRQVAVEIPETTYQRVVKNVTVPTQVGEWVVEEEVRQVPVCVCKIITEECVRRIPYTTCREVIERVENRVTVPVCKYIREQQVRMIPCTYTRMMYERRVQQVPVRVCRMVPVQKKILVPRCIQSMVPGKKISRVPRLVMLHRAGGDRIARQKHPQQQPTASRSPDREKKGPLLDDLPRPVLRAAARLALQWAYDEKLLERA